MDDSPTPEGLAPLDPIPMSPKIPVENRPIDKFFWFNLSRKWVSGGIQNVIDISERLKTAITWFFGLGTSGFFLSILIGSETFKGLDLTYLFVPLLLFFISYGLAVLGQTVSLSRGFRSNRHETIEKAYNTVMASSKWYIIGSAVTLMLALTSFPVILSRAVEEKKTEAQKGVRPELVLRGTYVLKDTTIKTENLQIVSKVHVSGTLPDIKQARLIVEKGKSSMTRIVIEETPLMPELKSGLFFIVIPLTKKPVFKTGDKIFVSIEFPGKDTTTSMRHTILIEETK